MHGRLFPPMAVLQQEQLLLTVGLGGTSPALYSWLTGGAFQHDPAWPSRLAGLRQDHLLAVVFLAASLGTVLLLRSRPRTRRRQ